MGEFLIGFGIGMIITITIFVFSPEITAEELATGVKEIRTTTHIEGSDTTYTYKFVDK